MFDIISKSVIYIFACLRYRIHHVFLKYNGHNFSRKYNDDGALGGVRMEFLTEWITNIIMFILLAVVVELLITTNVFAKICKNGHWFIVD